jgi:putative oxidoreductase
MIAFFTPTPSPPAREHNRKVALWMVQVVLAAQFALAGGLRLAGGFHHLSDRIAADLWVRSAGGTLEPGGVIGAVVPALFALAALGLVALVVVASVIHLVGLLAWAHWPAGRR